MAVKENNCLIGDFNIVFKLKMVENKVMKLVKIVSLYTPAEKKIHIFASVCTLRKHKTHQKSCHMLGLLSPNGYDSDLLNEIL